MANIRMALVETYPVREGGEASALAMARRETEIVRLLNKRGFDVRCFRTIRSDACSVATDRDVEWIFTPIDADTSDCPDRLTRSSCLVEELSEFNPDVIFVKGVGTATSRDLLKIRVRIRIAIIGGAHRTSELGYYHIVLIETPVQAKFLRPRVRYGNLMILPKYASSEFFTADRTALPSIDIITVGRLIPLKNLSLLAELPAHDYRIKICGDGPLRDELRSQLSQCGNSIEFAGELPTAELAESLGRSRVLAHPSRSEGLPRAVVEAMAAGTPPIYIEGVIVSPVLDESNSVAASPETFAEEVRRLLDDEERRERLSEQCRLTAQREFSVHRLEESVDALTERLLTMVSGGRTASWGASAELCYRRTKWRLFDLPVLAARKLRRARSFTIAVVRRRIMRRPLRPR